jgi:copper chaperone CopZ
LIERALLSNKGVEKAVVALATSRGHVEFDPTVLGPRDVIKMIEVEKLLREGGVREGERRERERERERIEVQEITIHVVIITEVYVIFF